jgi:hypothetical protein
MLMLPWALAGYEADRWSLWALSRLETVSIMVWTGQQPRPGCRAHHLPELNDVEEMLIARAHVHVQVRQIRGQQYQYSGHTVCFKQNTQKICNKLPLVLKDLNIIPLKPASGQASEIWAKARVVVYAQKWHTWDQFNVWVPCW